MATTIVYPSIDVSGTASVSTLISTAGTFTGSLTASALTVTGTATFSGTAVFVGPAQFLASVTFSGGVSFLGTVSFSATVAFLNATVTTLGVTGTASFSAPITVAGFPAGTALLGSLSLLANASIRFSGSWSDYAVLCLKILCKTSGASNTASVAIYTDGGTTAILATAVTSLTISTGVFHYLEAEIINGGGFKMIKTNLLQVAGAPTAQITATANTAFLNCIQFAAGASVTISSGHAFLYGMRGRGT